MKYLTDNELVEEIVDECRVSRKQDAPTKNLLTYIKLLIDRKIIIDDNLEHSLEIENLVFMFVEESMRTVTTNKGTDLFRELKRSLKNPSFSYIENYDIGGF